MTLLAFNPAIPDSAFFFGRLISSPGSRKRGGTANEVRGFNGRELTIGSAIAMTVAVWPFLRGLTRFWSSSGLENQSVSP